MLEKELVHIGSTKDVYRVGECYLFHFSDRYSVFDWGEMPDKLAGKGIALAKFTKNIYSHLETKNILTHQLNIDCNEDEMFIRPFEVIRDQKIMPKKENIFIPLEVIFRLGVASGSSLLKRGHTVGERFTTPMIEFTTKLERFDRPLEHDEARELANLSEGEWAQLLQTTETIALELEKLFLSVGIILWDGKVEFALGEKTGEGRQIILVDSIGPDELRLTSQDVQLSKEVIRQYYRSLTWYQELKEVKTKFGEEFKEHISAPPSLPIEFKNNVIEMYSLLPSLINKEDGTHGRLIQLLKKFKDYK